MVELEDLASQFNLRTQVCVCVRVSVTCDVCCVELCGVWYSHLSAV